MNELNWPTRRRMNGMQMNRFEAGASLTKICATHIGSQHRILSLKRKKNQIGDHALPQRGFGLEERSDVSYSGTTACSVGAAATF
jgi:hypothetical protein